MVGADGGVRVKGSSEGNGIVRWSGAVRRTGYVAAAGGDTSQHCIAFGISVAFFFPVPYHHDYSFGCKYYVAHER